jgi:hypothetical protein
MKEKQEEGEKNRQKEREKNRQKERERNRQEKRGKKTRGERKRDKKGEKRGKRRTEKEGKKEIWPRVRSKYHTTSAPCQTILEQYSSKYRWWLKLSIHAVLIFPS